MDEIIQAFNKHQVRYLLIGGQAMRLHGMPRWTMDWDIYIPPRDDENINRINHLLEDQLDMPLLPLGPRGENFIQTYQLAIGILQFHLAGPGFPRFDEAESRAVIRNTETGVPVKCLGSLDLLRTKEAAGRPEDARDLEFLREIEKQNPNRQNQE